MSQQEAVSATFGGDDGIDQFRSLANRPLYDMTEGIISLLPSASRDVAYVQAFRDCVLDFANSKKADISAFLEWWDQYGGDLCINTPEGQNAIRIMTIHKSKGLGMPAVILPCCYGTTDMTSRERATSLRRSFGNRGRTGRSITREVRIAFSEGFPPRLR